jgi:hypothetical protein
MEIVERALFSRTSPVTFKFPSLVISAISTIYIMLTALGFGAQTHFEMQT